jgi:hypothetical protein
MICNNNMADARTCETLVTILGPKIMCGNKSSENMQLLLR